MQLQVVKREKQKLRLSLQGGSGTGKTMSALLLAYGLCGDWRKILLIDTDSKASSLYSHLGEFNVIYLDETLSVDKYIEAVNVGEQTGMEVIIIDSITEEWIGQGGVLNELTAIRKSEIHKWNEIMQKHYHFVDTIVGTPVHVITTVKCNKYGPLQEPGYEHSFTCILSLDKKQRAHLVKDRTSLLKGISPQRLSIEIGGLLYAWAENSGSALPMEVQAKIEACNSLKDLWQLSYQYPDSEPAFQYALQKRRRELKERKLSNAA